MAYCSNCGVEVEARAESCPLCDAPIQRLDSPPAEKPRYPDVAPPPGRQVRYILWLVASAMLLSVALVCVALDVVVDPGIAWSLYPLAGAGVLWLTITLAVIFARRRIFVIVGQAVATAGYLLIIDLFDGRLDWFLVLALPIVAIVTGVFVLVWLVGRLTHGAPALLTASALFGSGAASVGLDLLISAHLGAMHMSWSFIVIAAAAPPMAFLLYFHFRLRRRFDLTRILHT